jgi:uncharacterized membrane protein (DUF2068 family)
MSWSYSAKVPGRRRPSNRYELITCAVKGHELVGTDARDVEPQDSLFVREEGGTRWYRCLRCDAWIPLPPPADPIRDRVPCRDEIDLPARGPVLRDKYVLRLIAIERGIHVLVFGTLAAILFTFAQHDVSIHHDYVDVMNDLSGGNPGESQVRGVLGYLGRAFKYSPHRLVQLGLAVTAYAALEACEMVGLWLNKRWAEYLTFVATTALIPFEVYELTLEANVLKLVTFVINLVIVVYLLLAKRLFGLRGGHRAEQERRRTLSGWTAVERATPAMSLPVGRV